MNELAPPSGHEIRGTIRRRLLVNAVVDPDEAAARLPEALRPRVTELGTVVGCCLLEIDAIRPGFLPAAAGRRMRAAAHRISVEWDDESGAIVHGVYVPVRHTDSRLAALVGGRWFPGVHERAGVEVLATQGALSWRSEPLDVGGLGIEVEVSYRAEVEPGPICDPVGTTCLDATVGISPDRRGRLEGAGMDLAHRDARDVVVEHLTSAFIGSFNTAELSTSYLMSDADVTWTRAAAPTTRAQVSA